MAISFDAMTGRFGQCQRTALGPQQTFHLFPTGLAADGRLAYIGKDVLRPLCYFLAGASGVLEQSRALRHDHAPQFFKGRRLIWSVEVNAAPDKFKELNRQFFTGLRQDVENKRERENRYGRRADAARNQIAPEFAACSKRRGRVRTREAFQFFPHLVRWA